MTNPPTITPQESILDTIKKLLGLDPDYTAFDIDITVFINSTFLGLTQLGVGPVNGFSVTDRTQTWASFFGSLTNSEALKSYIFLKVKLLFDPPTSSYVLDSMVRQIAEFEFRLNVQADPAPEIVPIVEDEFYDEYY